MVKRQKNIALFFVAALCVLAASTDGCVSDSFILPDANGGSNSSLSDFDCHMVTGYGSAEQNGGTFTIHPGGIVSARKYGETGFTAEFYIRITKGNAARIRVRSEDVGTSVLPGICLTFGTDNSFIDVPGRPRKEIPFRASNDWQRVQIFSYANGVKIRIGCDDVFATKTHLFSTDYLVFESVGQSEVQVAKMKSQGMQ